MPPRGCKGYPVQGGQLPGPLDTSRETLNKARDLLHAGAMLLSDLLVLQWVRGLGSEDTYVVLDYCVVRLTSRLAQTRDPLCQLR